MCIRDSRIAVVVDAVADLRRPGVDGRVTVIAVVGTRTERVAITVDQVERPIEVITIRVPRRSDADTVGLIPIVIADANERVGGCLLEAACGHDLD